MGAQGFVVLLRGGNLKLGKGVAHYSRSVGPTCPAECPFACGAAPPGAEPIAPRHRCYKARIDGRYRAAREAAARNVGTTAAWAAALRADVERLKPGVPWRPLVGGDLLAPDGRLDRVHLAAVLRAARATKGRNPCWLYTHAWRYVGPRHRRAMERAGIVARASVHSAGEATQALAAGWKLALDAGAAPLGPGWHEVHGVRALACPEQVFGHERVTCGQCRYCFRDDTGHVAFSRH